MLPSNQLPGPESQADNAWIWLKARLDRVALLEATHELDEWFGAELQQLESEFQHMVTVESCKIVASSLVQTSRRR